MSIAANTSAAEVLDDRFFDVVVSGGGPGGLSLAYLLGSYGVKVAVLEKEVDLPRAPRGQHAHPTTAELWRAWGVLDLLEKTDHGPNWDLHAKLPERLWGSITKGPLLVYPSRESYARDQELVARISPETRLFSAHYQYGPLIARQAAAWPTVTLLNGYTVRDVSQDANRVLLTAITEDGDEVRFGARYLVGADGQRSAVRDALGIDRIEGALHDDWQISINFRGDVDRYGELQFMNHIFTLGRNAYLARRPFHPLETDVSQQWSLVLSYSPHEDASIERLEHLVRTAIGDDAFDLEILDFNRFPVRSALAEKWRYDRILLLGDAAHQHSPWNGYGQNLANAEANNLAWKLASVIRGDANETLLDTYEVERRSAAINVIRLTTYHDAVRKLLEQAYYEFHDLDLDEYQAKVFLGAFSAQLGKNDIYFEFGERYNSAAVISDGSALELGSDADDYRRNGTPGGRAPHVWLKSPDGTRLSIRHLLGKSWVLLADDPHGHWNQAAGSWKGDGVSELRLETIGNGQSWTPEEDWASITGINPGGALLVRPDGFIAARLESPHDEVTAITSLSYSLASVLRAPSVRGNE